MTNACESFKEMRIVEFNGNEDEWQRRSKKFIAVAKVQKFANIVGRSLTVPKLTDNIQDQDMTIKDLNQAAYCCLLHCMNDDIALDI